MDSPLVSIIVPNYNHEKYLKLRLDSILNQTYQNFEVILLDDCSTDNSKEVLLNYANHKKVTHCIFNEENSGNVFLQWNKGLSLARGEYIWIAESDDYCEENFLYELTKYLIKDDEITLVYCQSNKVDEQGIVKGSWLDQIIDLNKELFLSDFIMEGNEFVEKFLIAKNVIPNASAVLFRKAHLFDVGNPEIYPWLKYNGDWTFYLRLILNKKIAFVHNPLNNYRYHSESVIANAVKKESYISLKKIEIKSREKMNDYLMAQKSSNCNKIILLNNNIIKHLKYEQALYFLRNPGKLKSVHGFYSVVKMFLINKEFRKRILAKCKQYLKSVY